MRFLSADYIFTNTASPIKEGVLVIKPNAEIVDILPSRQAAVQQYNLNSDLVSSEIEIYRGILCPGFVNCHLHLELSHLKNKFQRRQGLPAFLEAVIKNRSASPEEISEAMHEADREMQREGIVAAGDIANTFYSLTVKKESPIYYHTFVEVFDLDPGRADEVFEKGKELVSTFKEAGLSASMSPHAPYSVSPRLLKLISGEAYSQDSVLTIHNQETAAENEMFERGEGALLSFFQKVQPYYKAWNVSGFRSLASSFVHLPRCNRIQFVHNTYSKQEDIQWAQLYSLFVWWCFCPNANLFIEGKLPEIPLFDAMAGKICIGTDSLASNDRLSILEELKSIQSIYPEISTEKLLRWATLGGAEFLGIEKKFGIFEKGRNSGINLVEHIDTESLKLSADSKVRAYPF